MYAILFAQNCKRRGDFLLSMVLAAVLFLAILNGLIEMRMQTQDSREQNYVVEELAYVGRALQSYIESNRKELLELPAFQRGDADTAVLVSDSNATVRDGITRYLGGSKTFSDLRNIWGDSYHAVFIRSKNPAETTTMARTDSLTAYVYASGVSWNGRHRAGTEAGDRWLNGGMRRAALRGGSAFGFVEGGVLRSGGFETALGIGSAHNGDLAYLVRPRFDDMVSETLQRYPTGDEEDQTMHADIDGNDNNLLNVRYLEAQAIDTGSVRFDPTLYETAQQAEDSCRNDWIFMRDQRFGKEVEAANQTKRKLFVTQNGRVYTWTGTTSPSENDFLGTLGMNDGQMAQRLLPNGVSGENDVMPVTTNQISNVGRVYYISPTEVEVPGATRTDPTREAHSQAFANRAQLAVCRVVNGKRTLAYIGDNRTEDKIAFVVSAVDGDFIPPFYCPGQSAEVAGGGVADTYSVPHVNAAGTDIETSTTGADTLFNSGRNTDGKNLQGIMPRLFVMPQMVSSGSKAFPIQGIKAWAETVNTDGSISQGWIIRLNALIDVQYGKVNKRTYWVGNIPRNSQTGHSYNITTEAGEDMPGYKTTQDVEYDLMGTTNRSVDYLRAIVIGVCSGKAAAF